MTEKNICLNAYSTLPNGIIKYPRGSKIWYLNGIRHREDGPAVEWADGTKEWWVNGEFVCSDSKLIGLKNNYVVVERGIPTNEMFGDLKLTKAKLLTAEGTVFIWDNLPGLEIGE